VPAFTFACDGCSLVFVSPIPEVGTFIDFACGGCGKRYHLLWTGKFWVRGDSEEAKKEFVPLAVEVRNDVQIAEDALKVIEERQKRSMPRT